MSCEGNGAVPGQTSSRDLVTVSFSKLVAKGIESFTVGTVNTPELGSVYFQYRAVKDESDPNPGLTIGAKTEWTDLVTGDNREPGLAHTIQLCRGTWNITLRGFASDEARLAAGVKETGDKGVKAIFEGASERSEIGGNLSERSQTVDVTLGFTNPAGSGRYTIAVRLPQNHASQNGQVRVTVRDSGNAEQTATKTYGAESLSENFEFDNVPNGIATVKVEYLTPDGATVLGSGEGTTLIMTDMHTSGTASVAEDDTYEVRFTVNNAVGSPEGLFVPTTFNSLFEIYPDTIADNEIVVGYYKPETKALDVTPISFPAEILTGDAVKDEQGMYKASELGLVPVTVTTSSDLNASGATEAWWGKTASVGFSATANTTLASVQFVDGVTSIKDYAFKGCTNLTSVTIPEGVTSIGSSAFQNCTGLTSITISDGVTSIGGWAFYGCKGLTSITIPEGVTTIGDWAFYGCTGLTDIYVNQAESTLLAKASVPLGCKIHWNSAGPGNP